MAVSSKLNNVDFPPLPFPSVSKPISSVLASLPYINIAPSKSFVKATNTPIYSVPQCNASTLSLTLILLVTFQLNTIIGLFANPLKHLNLFLQR